MKPEEVTKSLEIEPSFTVRTKSESSATATAIALSSASLVLGSFIFI
jgi:hypothetical protein